MAVHRAKNKITAMRTAKLARKKGFKASIFKTRKGIVVSITKKRKQLWRKVGNVGFENIISGTQLNFGKFNNRFILEIITIDGNNTIPFHTKEERKKFTIKFMKAHKR